MSSLLISIIVVLIVVCLIVWAIQAFMPGDGRIKSLIIFLVKFFNHLGSANIAFGWKWMRPIRAPDQSVRICLNQCVGKGIHIVIVADFRDTIRG